MPKERQEQACGREGNQARGEFPPCAQCGSDTYGDLVKAALWSRTGWIAIEDIPARVCQACAEQFYDEKTVQEIEKIIAHPTLKAKQQIQVPVFSLTDVEILQGHSRPEVLDEEETAALESMFAGTEQARQQPAANGEHPDAFLCKYCESDTHEDIVKSVLWGDRGLVVVEDIPARVCPQCGEQFYDEETTRKIEKIIADPSVKAKQEIAVPVFSLAELEGGATTSDSAT